MDGVDKITDIRNEMGLRNQDLQMFGPNLNKIISNFHTLSLEVVGRGSKTQHRARILVQVTINRRLLIGRDGHLDQSEAYDLS